MAIWCKPNLYVKALRIEIGRHFKKRAIVGFIVK
jgi:hypothetical protein